MATGFGEAGVGLRRQARADGSSFRLGSAGRDGTEQDVQQLLWELCDGEREALILGPAAGRLWKARFSELLDDAVILVLPRGEEVAPIGPATHLCVTFSFESRAGVFLASVFEVRRPSPEVPSNRLVVGIPEQVLLAGRRLSFRVPIPSRRGLELVLRRADGTELRPEPLDISLTGMGVQFELAEDPELVVGEQLDASLRLFETVAELPVVVRRSRDRGRYGLYFEDVRLGPDIDPPEEIRAIFKALERRWLQAAAL